MMKFCGVPDQNGRGFYPAVLGNGELLFSVDIHLPTAEEAAVYALKEAIRRLRVDVTQVAHGEIPRDSGG